MFASTLTSGRISAGNSTFLIRLPPAMSDPAASDQRRGKPGPRQDAAEHEQRERLELLRLQRRHHDGEDERVDQQEQERVDEGPEETERRPTVARFQLARDQALDQAAIAERGCARLERNYETDSSASRHLQADQRLQERDARPLGIRCPRPAARAAPRRASSRPRRAPVDFVRPSRRSARGSSPDPAAPRRSRTRSRGSASPAPGGTTARRRRAPPSSGVCPGRTPK